MKKLSLSILILFFIGGSGSGQTISGDLNAGFFDQNRMNSASAAIPLESLIELINQDSLFSYTSRLQAFGCRQTGSYANQFARDWLLNNLISFGYDSIYCDTFPAQWEGQPLIGHNIIVHKAGTTYPDHQIIVGAHYDTRPNTLGADDNGSGTAALLEIARILAPFETRTSITLIFFDAEDSGLWGSRYYADSAHNRGDSIIYMMNLDMLGNIDNDTLGRLYYGADLTYTMLWDELADSLVGIKGVLSDDVGADEESFKIYGYQTTFVHEYNRSTHLHTPSDSTTYMNFEYMTRMTKASLASIYTISRVYLPNAALSIQYVGGATSIVWPGRPDTLEITATGINGMVPRSDGGYFYYSLDGGPYQAVSMPEISPDHFLAIFPPMHCLTEINYYVGIRDTAGIMHYNPQPTAPYKAMASTGLAITFHDNFETDKGWTVSGDATDGQWMRGRPLMNQWPAPPCAYDSAGDYGYDCNGQCYLTDNTSVNSDVDNGTTTLISPLLDLSTGSVVIDYARWFVNNFGSNPQTFSSDMNVYISNNDGATWSLVEEVGPIADYYNRWVKHSFRVDDILSPSAMMRIRVDVIDTGPDSQVEAGLDEFRVLVYECPVFMCGDVSGDAIVNILDVTSLIIYLYKQGSPPYLMEAADVNHDTRIDIRDITFLINYLYKGGPPPICP
jgi:Peptidase family M28/Dockerin type I domain